MSDCVYLKDCPVWQHFSAAIKHVWIDTYCRGPRQARCARLQLAQHNKPVPVDLLPNGTKQPASTRPPA